MFTESFALVVRTLQTNRLEYVASVGGDGSPVCFTEMGKRAPRFRDADASLVVSRSAAAENAWPLSMLKVAICPVRSLFDERGFTVFLKVRLGDGPDMGGVIDGTAINAEFSSSALGSLHATPQGGRAYYINRLFVPAATRGFGIANAMLTELCNRVDEQAKETALLVEPSPYDESINRCGLINLFKKHGFVEKGETLMIRLRR